MVDVIRDILRAGPITASAPCRIDMGGTLDLSTFYIPLRSLEPCTFNMALSLRTTVRIEAWEQGCVRIASKGFKSAEFPSGLAPFNHPLGFMFAVANYFNADGISITIESASPPRSALGGSSSAAVALVATLQEAVSRSGGKPMTRRCPVTASSPWGSSAAPRRWSGSTPWPGRERSTRSPGRASGSASRCGTGTRSRRFNT